MINENTKKRARMGNARAKLTQGKRPLANRWETLIWNFCFNDKYHQTPVFNSLYILRSLFQCCCWFLDQLQCAWYLYSFTFSSKCSTTIVSLETNMSICIWKIVDYWVVLGNPYSRIQHALGTYLLLKRRNIFLIDFHI